MLIFGDRYFHFLHPHPLLEFVLRQKFSCVPSLILILGKSSLLAIILYSNNNMNQVHRYLGTCILYSVRGRYSTKNGVTFIFQGVFIFISANVVVIHICGKWNYFVNLVVQRQNTIYYTEYVYDQVLCPLPHGYK